MSNSLTRGLYETLLTESLEAELGSVSEDLSAHVSALRTAEAAEPIAEVNGLSGVAFT